MYHHGKHELVLFTEKQINACLSPRHSSRVETPHWTLWMDLDSSAKKQNVLETTEVLEEADWQTMLEIRADIEGQFGVQDIFKIHGILAQIKRIKKCLPSSWYFVWSQEKIVGQFGLVFFDIEGQKVGRLQDVDILPKYQGAGFGNSLLTTIISKCYDLKMNSVCLMADASDWPKDWYMRRGFTKLGVT